MTLVVNLFAGPGAGKSTTAARVFYELKSRSIEAELAHEYAKDLTWENRQTALSYQPYVTAKQIWRVARLIDKVDVVITDSPILLCDIYRGDGYTNAFRDYVVSVFGSWDTLNFLLLRHDGKKYSPKGRGQTEQQALEIDVHMKMMLERFQVEYKEVLGPPWPCHESITERVISAL